MGADNPQTVRSRVGVVRANQRPIMCRRSSRQSLARPVTLLRSKLTRCPAPGFCLYDSALGELLCHDDGEFTGAEGERDECLAGAQGGSQLRLRSCWWWSVR
jgi:hypothetical protein